MMASETSTGQIVPSKSITLDRTRIRDGATWSQGSQTAPGAAPFPVSPSTGPLFRRGSCKAEVPGDPPSAPVAFDRVAVLQRVKIDALDIVVVRGGGRDVAAWAERNGFDLTPDTPKVLSAYSSQGAIFALARFDRAAAAEKGLIEGQGTVIQFTIPTRAPWIPLRILALGKQGSELVDADLFVLTDQKPWFAPGLSSMPGLQVRQQGWASDQLLTDLRSDRRMGWVPP